MDMLEFATKNPDIVHKCLFSNRHINWKIHRLRDRQRPCMLTTADKHGKRIPWSRSYSINENGGEDHEFRASRVLALRFN